MHVKARMWQPLNIPMFSIQIYYVDVNFYNHKSPIIFWKLFSKTMMHFWVDNSKI